jgi:hypothetical protein
MMSRKTESVLVKNSGYETLCSISRILTGESFSTFNIEEELPASDLVHLKYTPIVSADVERSFSKYKNVFSDNRRSLTFKNLRMLTSSVATLNEVTLKYWNIYRICTFDKRSNTIEE